jgi:hypothetical protein
VEAGTITARGASLALLVRLGARVQLAAIVSVSVLLRAVALDGHPTPGYFPDEYIYATLGRSLGEHGKPLVRGGVAHFPALLEPLLAAPLWALAPLDVAYRLVQLEQALFMSLAAIPAYLIARELRLAERYALLCAAFAVAIPDLVYSAYVVADPVAYPLVLASLYAALLALVRRSRRYEVAFLLLAGLATFARVQYVVLVPAFGVAAAVLERRHVLRTYRVFAAALLVVAAVGLAVGPGRLLGYYSNVLHHHIGLATAKWALVDLFLLALASGAVLVPGAVAGLLRPRGRAERAFVLLATSFGGAVLLEAATYASNGSPRFQERYLFTLLPLVPLAFGLHCRRQRPLRLPLFLIGIALVVALARVPLSAYATTRGITDSQFLSVLVALRPYLDVDTASLAVALAASVAVAAGVALAMRQRAAAGVAAAVALLLLVSVGATVQDSAWARSLRRDAVATNPSWVDASGLRHVVAIQTPNSPPWELLEQLIWNRSIEQELLLGGAEPTDAFPAPAIRVAHDGTLVDSSGVVRSPILFQTYGASASFAGVSLAERSRTFELFEPAGTPRVRLLETGRYSDGWLAASGRLTVWPDTPGNTHGTLAFTLSLPRGTRPVAIRFGRRHLRIEPGQQLRLRVGVAGSGPQTLTFAAAGGTYDANLRHVSVRSTMPVFSASAPGARDRSIGREEG